MGQEPSAPPREFDTAWRTMAWGKKNELEQKLRNFKLRYPNVQFVRILIVGEVGAGKSSFINSVNNAFQKRITSGALVDGIGGTSFTKVYKTHYIAGEDGFPLPFALSDIMGLEANQSGAHEKDIVKALHGFLDEGYKFNPAFPVSPNDPGYRSNPGLHDQTFCLVNVVAADKISLMNNHVIEKLKKIREAATDLNIPQVVIMTRPDLACLLVKENLQKIYTSKKIKEKMQECSNLLGIPMNHIFPVKNYHEEINTNDDMDLLILTALDQVVHIAADALKEQLVSTSSHPE